MKLIVFVLLVLLLVVPLYAQLPAAPQADVSPPALIGYSMNPGGFAFVYEGEFKSYSPLFGVNGEFYDMLASHPASSALAKEAREAMRLGAWIAVPSGVLATAGGVGLGVCIAQMFFSLFTLFLGGDFWVPPEWLVYSSIGAALLGSAGSIIGSLEMNRGYALGFDAVDAWNRAAFGDSR